MKTLKNVFDFFFFGRFGIDANKLVGIISVGRVCAVLRTILKAYFKYDVLFLDRCPRVSSYFTSLATRRNYRLSGTRITTVNCNDSNARFYYYY